MMAPKNWEILHGDCLLVMRDIESGSVDSVVTDPPYGIDYQSARRTDSQSRKPKILNDTRPYIWFLPEAFRVLKEGGCLVCFCRWDVQEAFRLAIEWAGLEVKSQVIWDRGSHGMGDLNASFAPQHDVVWFATKGKGFTFPGKRPTSIVPSMRVGAQALIHPNEKPVELMGYLIRTVTPPGGLVVDPFSGSGATVVAAVRDGYRAIGIELDPDHVKRSRERLEVPSDLFNPGAGTLFGNGAA